MSSEVLSVIADHWLLRWQEVMLQRSLEVLGWQEAMLRRTLDAPAGAAGDPPAMAAS